jgi:hypothetical protein
MDKIVDVCGYKTTWELGDILKRFVFSADSYKDLPKPKGILLISCWLKPLLNSINCIIQHLVMWQTQAVVRTWCESQWGHAASNGKASNQWHSLPTKILDATVFKILMPWSHHCSEFNNNIIGFNDFIISQFMLTHEVPMFSHTLIHNLQWLIKTTREN